MNWPEAFAFVGGALAFAAVVWAVAYKDSHSEPSEPPDYIKQPGTWTTYTINYPAGQQRAKGAQDPKVTPADQIPKPKED